MHTAQQFTYQCFQNSFQRQVVTGRIKQQTPVREAGKVDHLSFVDVELCGGEREELYQKRVQASPPYNTQSAYKLTVPSSPFQASWLKVSNPVGKRARKFM